MIYVSQNYLINDTFSSKSRLFLINNEIDLPKNIMTLTRMHLLRQTDRHTDIMKTLPFRRQ